MSETLKDKTSKGLFWGAINNGGMQILNMVFGIIVARLLTPDDFGVIAMITIFSAIASNIQDSGFMSALINRKEPTQTDFNSVFWFNVIVSAIIYIVLWWCAPLIANYNHQPVLVPLARYAFIGFFLASFSIVPRSMLIKAIRMKEQTIISLISLAASGTVGIVMAVNGMSYWGLATQNIVYIGLVSILSMCFARWLPTFTFSIKPIKEMFGFSWKLLVTNMVNNLNRYCFETLLGRFFPRKDIGQYYQANKWNVTISSFITGMVNGVVQPMFVIVRDEDGDRERYQRVFRKMLRFISFISFPAMFGLALVAQEFICVTLTDKYIESARLLQMLSVGGAFLPIAALYYNFLISRGKSDVFMWNMIAQVICVFLDLFVVMCFHLNIVGLSGIRLMIAIYVLIIILWTFIWHIYVWREIRLSLWHSIKDILPFMLISLLTMLVTYFITKDIENLILLLVSRVLLAAVIYVGILWLMKAEILRECVGYLKKKK